MIDLIDWLRDLWCRAFHAKHHKSLSRDKYAHHVLCTRCLEYREKPE